MSEELTPEEQKEIDELSEAIANALAEGKSKRAIVEELIEHGWPEGSANQFVNDIEQTVVVFKNSPEGRQLADAYARHMTYGILWIVGGTIVTVATYQAAFASGGGTYIIAWGAILFGIIDFFRGFFGWLRYSS